ncbi:MAG TPA: ATP phosphoribosyltransferase regulatory subunit [Bauldia sp.]|nr:ATP phosphoribosyltransferase regulatory subunit [Bauldia sp.]
MTRDYAPLRALFTDAGYAFVEPPLLFDASVFVELAGEDLRRRLFLSTAADGTELALRPDYTIPVCLQHLASGKARRRANYAYLGPVFRQRRDEPGEFLQAGVESLGRTDRALADADMLKLALSAVATLGVAAPAVRIGDSALFAAVLQSLDLAEPWRRRLARAFGDRDRLKALLARLASGAKAPALPDGVPAGKPAALRRAVSDMLLATGLATVGGRDAGEIAARFAEKAELARGNRHAPKVLTKFLAIAGAPRRAAAAVRRLAAAEKLDLDAALGDFETRLDNFARDRLDLSKLAFAADFGRRLDYYTGFVFEMYGREDKKPIVGGGRYDRLLSLIGAGGPVPAVGFAIWLDRIGAAR